MLDKLAVLPPTSKEELKEFYTSNMSVRAKLPPTTVDKFTKNKALVTLLHDSELYDPRLFIVDFQGYETNTSKQVTIFRSRPDVVVYRKILHMIVKFSV